MIFIISTMLRFVLDHLPLVIGLLFFIVFILGIPLTIFLAALFEKCRISNYEQVASSDDKNIPSRCLKARDSALSLGFYLLGEFVDEDKGMLKGHHLGMLSPEKTSIVMLNWSKVMGRFKVMSRIGNDKWIITGDTLGIPDLSGVDKEEVVQNGALPEVLQLHYERIREAVELPVPFEPEAITSDLVKQHERRVDRYERSGLARRLTADKRRYRYTLKGAVRILLRYFGNLSSAFRTY